MARTIDRNDITGIVLAGGQGRRMGSVDKGLIDYAGSPLVMQVLARLEPQVGQLMINANQNIDRYESFGHPVVSDLLPEFAGPLAGLQAGMAAATTRYVVTVPCDSPDLPLDLVARLASALALSSAPLCVARTSEHAQPVFALVATALLPRLTAFLADSGRKIDAWHASVGAIHVDFADEAAAFRNINTPADLAESVAAGANTAPRA
jgi:molybdopterin-guanine dinucleotide biosynthesis protein A